MHIGNEIKQGWDFSARIACTDIAAGLGNAYIGEVERAIAEFTRQIANLKGSAAQADAALGGFIAEYWHAGTFNINAASAGSRHRAWVDEANRQTYASVDIDTNFGNSYSSKYMSSAKVTAREQALLNPETRQAKYHGQERLVPSDQLDEAREIAMRRFLSNEEVRPENAEAYRETAEHMTDTVSDGRIHSEKLSKSEDIEIAQEVKQGDFFAEKHGIGVETAVKAEYIVKEAMRAGLTAAAVTAAIQLAPEIYKAIDYLIKNGKIDLAQIRKIGTKALSAGAEGFLRGSVSCSLLIMCRKGLLGDAFRSIDPTGLATAVAIIGETVKNSILVVAGHMSAKQMGTAFLDSMVVSGGYVLGSKIGGMLGNLLGFQLPVVGYLVGSLVGTAFAVVYNIGKKKLISFCAETGFTCFGLVDQNYELPEEVLQSMGISCAHIARIPIERAGVSRIPLSTPVSTAKYETINITMVRRGVIGINKIGYVL